MSLTHTAGKVLWQHRLLPKRIARPVFKRLLRSEPSMDLPFTADFFGIRYEGNLSNNIDYNICFYGAFEKPLLYFLSDALAASPPGDRICVDVGANVGQHSLYMSRHASEVHAFEPFEPVRARLQHQIAVNAIRNIHVHEQALSNAPGRLPFFAPTGNNAGIGSFDASTVSKGNKPIGELALIRGDDFFAEQAPERIDLIKIDVEGFEKPALEGLQQTLAKYRPLLVCEITYGKELSFSSREEILALLPPDYSLLTFDKRKADGSKARRRDAKARRSGKYRIIPYTQLLQAGQDDVIMVPAERLPSLPLGNSQSYRSQTKTTS